MTTYGIQQLFEVTTTGPQSSSHPSKPNSHVMEFWVFGNWFTLMMVAMYCSHVIVSCNLLGQLSSKLNKKISREGCNFFWWISPSYFTKATVIAGIDITKQCIILCCILYNIKKCCLVTEMLVPIVIVTWKLPVFLLSGLELVGWLGK